MIVLRLGVIPTISTFSRKVIFGYRAIVLSLIGIAIVAISRSGATMSIPRARRAAGPTPRPDPPTATPTATKAPQPAATPRPRPDRAAHPDAAHARPPAAAHDRRPDAGPHPPRRCRIDLHLHGTPFSGVAYHSTSASRYDVRVHRRSALLVAEVHRQDV